MYADDADGERASEIIKEFIQTQRESYYYGEENMLVFNVTFKCKDGMRNVFLDAVFSEGIASAARSEPGNLKYDWYISADNGTDLLLIEKYRDEESVAEHVRQPHTARLVKLKEAYVGDMILEEYEDHGKGID